MEWVETEEETAAHIESNARYQRALLRKAQGDDKADAAQAAIELLAWYAANGEMDDAGVQAAIERGQLAVMAKVLAVGLNLKQGARENITPLHYFRDDGRGGGRFKDGVKEGFLQLRDVLEMYLTREDVIGMLTTEDGEAIAPDKWLQTVKDVEQALVDRLVPHYGGASRSQVRAFVRASLDEFWPQPWDVPGHRVDYDDLL